MKLVNSVTYHFLFQLTLILAFATQSPLIYLILLILTGALVAKNINLVAGLDRSARVIIYSYATIVTLSVAIKFFFQPIILAQTILVVFSIIPALILTKNLRVFVKASGISIYFYQIFTIAYSFIHGLEQFPVVVPFENLIPGSSANGITSYLILLQVNYSICYYLYKNKIDLISPLFTLGVALLGFGRGSILAAMLIVVVSLFFWIFKKKGMRIFGYLTLIFLFIFFIFLKYQTQIAEFLVANTKLSAGLVDDSRAQILRDYIQKINFLTFFVGTDYSNTSIVNLYGGNPHNSFIRAHHIFGLPYLLFVVFIPALVIFKRELLLDILFFGALFLVLYFRIFSEPIIFPTIFDFFYWTPLIIILRLSNSYNYTDVEK